MCGQAVRPCWSQLTCFARHLIVQVAASGVPLHKALPCSLQCAAQHLLESQRRHLHQICHQVCSQSIYCWIARSAGLSALATCQPRQRAHPNRCLHHSPRRRDLEHPACLYWRWASLTTWLFCKSMRISSMASRRTILSCNLVCGELAPCCWCNPGTALNGWYTDTCQVDKLDRMRGGRPARASAQWTRSPTQARRVTCLASGVVRRLRPARRQKLEGKWPGASHDA